VRGGRGDGRANPSAKQNPCDPRKAPFWTLFGAVKSVAPGRASCQTSPQGTKDAGAGDHIGSPLHTVCGGRGDGAMRASRNAGTADVGREKITLAFSPAIR